jgi:hypothetical protein
MCDISLKVLFEWPLIMKLAQFQLLTLKLSFIFLAIPDLTEAFVIILEKLTQIQTGTYLTNVENIVELFRPLIHIRIFASAEIDCYRMSTCKKTQKN